VARLADHQLRLKSELRARPRRLRRTPQLRALVRETRLFSTSLVVPIFVVSGRGREEPIASLPGHGRLSPDLAVVKARGLAALGVGGVLLFGIPDVKDADGRAASEPEGPVPQTLRRIRDAGIELVLAADVCLCEYTTHGHCGVLKDRHVDNDATLPLLAEAAVAYAEAGADIVAPSAMMDGQVAALRSALDSSGHEQALIMAYASKAASALYGPFREAAGATPAFGDRKAYQMDYANGREAIREMELDAEEEADLLMVKPAITSLDLLARARDLFNLPLAAYQVSGEAAMIEAAADRGWVDRESAVLETLTAIARAGADVIISYFAADAARWLGGDPASLRHWEEARPWPS
jgi:porphobilinogen synthase